MPLLSRLCANKGPPKGINISNYIIVRSVTIQYAKLCMHRYVVSNPEIAMYALSTWERKHPPFSATLLDRLLCALRGTYLGLRRIVVSGLKEKV